jgi:origin recognition complex subunit 4
VDAEEVDELESFESEEEAEYETPRTAPRGRGRPRLSDKLSASATKKATQRKDVLPSFDDDVFGTNSSPAAAAISRETFLKNEALRRQREARNFTFEGDANAPRQTRSGRVVADAEVDEYGGGEPETDEGTEAEVEVDAEGAEGEGDEEMGEIDGHDHEVSESEAVDDVDVNSDIEMDETPADITPLPSAAQPHVRRILETLTGREAEPAPLPDEAGNDTLQGIVSLLRGTVERGEGNSALVTGPRGAGKTRVSLNNHN